MAKKWNQFIQLWKEEVKVEFPLNGNYTMVRCDYNLRFRLIEIPTKLIPSDLRSIGSRFNLTIYGPHKDKCETIEDVKDALENSIIVERI